MIYLLIALALIFIVASLYLSYQKSHDIKRCIISLMLLVMLLILTYSLKIVMVYKPVLVLHIALLLMGWRGYYAYIKQQKKLHFWIFSPLVSLSLFIAISLFFRENG